MSKTEQKKNSRVCFTCKKELTAYKIRFCSDVCQRNLETRKKRFGIKIVSNCHEADMRVSRKGCICLECNEWCSPTTLYPNNFDDE